MTIELALLTGVSHCGRKITGPRLRGLLALLADDLRTGCSAARQVDGLRPDERPENPTKAFQVLDSRVRSQLGPDAVASTPTGYRMGRTCEAADSPRLHGGSRGRRRPETVGVPPVGSRETE